MRTSILVLTAAAVLASASSAFALDKMVAAVHATPAELATAGLGGMTGAGITIGVLEAGDGIAKLANPFLPGTISLIPQGALAADVITNHATEVTGVMLSQGPIYLGISPGASAEAAGISGPVQFIRNGQAAGANAADGGFGVRTPIINMSFGLNVAAGANNGTNIRDQWLDWAAISNPFANVEDILFVVAGNEGSPGVPSDAFNCLNVAATGRINGGNLVYDREAPYNTSNTTGDLSPITNSGRIKTELLAPGGDPSPRGAVGTFNAPPASINRFIAPGGGQWEFAGTDGAGNPRYDNDDFNNGGLTDDPYRATDTAPPLIPGPPFPPRNPGANLGGNDSLQADTIAGTSFAAPLVSGAAALLRQKNAVDHRVMKAILLTGASKKTPDGAAPLLDRNGLPWSRAVSQAQGFTKPDPVYGGNVPIQVGLDTNLGTGQMDLIRSGRILVAGQQGPGNVLPIGWDFQNALGSLGINSYTFNAAAGEFDATLCWDRRVGLNEPLIVNGLWDSEDTNGNGVLDPGEDTNGNAVLDQESFNVSALYDLDLELYNIPPVGPPARIDFSTSDIDNVEHVYSVLIPGKYRLDVVNRSANAEGYGLAWTTVPEPSSVAVLVVVSLLAGCRRRRRA